MFTDGDVACTEGVVLTILFAAFRLLRDSIPVHSVISAATVGSVFTVGSIACT